MFLGLAVGDALGAAVEFEPPGTFEPVTDLGARASVLISTAEATGVTVRVAVLVMP